MQKNIGKMVENIQSAEHVEVQAKNLQEEAAVFHKGGKEMNNEMK